MSKRSCKVCLKEKEFNYFCLNTQGRAVHKDQDGAIWHGKRCGACHVSRVRDDAGKPRLGAFKCVLCGAEEGQKHIRQKYCDRCKGRTG